MSANPNYKPSECKREEFRKYLEKTGVMDALTKVLVSLYEEPDKPENAVEYICNKLANQICGETLTDIQGNLKDALSKITELEKENAVWKDLINNKRMVVTDEMVCEVVSMMTGIPISKISQNEINKLINIDKEISNTVVGQDDAIHKVSSAIKRNRTGIRKQNKPIGS